MNRFLVNNRDEIAIQYSDNSVLQNIDCLKIFSMMAKTGCNIFEILQPDYWAKARKLIIAIDFETDMPTHFEGLGMFKTRALRLLELIWRTKTIKVWFYQRA